jgi:transposase InsO family protein
LLFYSHHGLGKPHGSFIAAVEYAEQCILHRRLEEAIARYSCPDIFNTDKGSQFNAEAFTDTLRSHSISISMDGTGRWMYNVFIERLWKSLKYEDVYLKAYSSMTEARKGLALYFTNSTTKNGGTITLTRRLRLWVILILNCKNRLPHEH